jgi:vacuolar-type H+-ATPase subunit H
MVEGIKNLDVTSVRDAADRARDIGRMLTPDAQARIGDAIEAARAAARKIVKAGEQAAQEIDQRNVQRITEARTAFLDLDPAAEVAAPVEEARALDFEPTPERTIAPSKKARGRRSAPAPV